MNLPVIILGAGGHAKVLIDALKLRSVEIAGIVDPDREKHGTNILGIPVIGNDDVVLKKAPGTVMLVNGLGSVKQPKLRKQLFDSFKARGFTFASVIHPSAVVAPDVVLGEGCQVMAGSVIQPGCVIGSNTIINTRASVDHDCTISSHVHIAPGVTLSGNVVVEERVHIGAGATVLQGVRIGRNSVIGAGAVVLQDVPEEVLVYGVPGKVVSK
jgi:sugar O-acyltransferase (sialic acid O-acetyltransferase NeuD family)